MRITTELRRLATPTVVGLMLAVAVAGTVAAQSGQQPPVSQFGPRIKPAQGQGQQAQQAQAPAAETVATKGSWKVQCETTPANGNTPAQRQCGMVQGSTNEKNPNAFINVILTRAKQGEKQTTTMRLIVPVGVFLPQGVAFEIDSNAIGRTGYIRCTPQICMAQAEVIPETLDKMRKGKEANFIIYEAPGIGLPLKIKLDGFGAALAELDKL
ncbi:MAG: invasion associated locus B family protein [Rhizobiales bacterium]|nr:invasion associated locus B family protein [Hyphomicrobiales bacterium]MBI3672139.1 invasion associated locus B family protein [Hyphomicrobiales bacterium]